MNRHVRGKWSHFVRHVHSETQDLVSRAATTILRVHLPMRHAYPVRRFGLYNYNGFIGFRIEGVAKAVEDQTDRTSLNVDLSSYGLFVRFIKERPLVAWSLGS